MRLYVAFVAAVVFFLYFYRASAVGLLGPDEPRYAQVAREMLRSHGFLTPHLLGRPWFEKPPLYYWLAAASFRVLGVGEAAARFPAALSAAAFLLLFGWLARRLFPGETARYAVLILASSLGWIGFARAATMEMLFAASLAGALGFLGLWLWQGRDAWLYLFYGLLAVSVLAKGLAGIVLAALILAVYCAVTREFRWLLRVLHPGPVMLLLVLALPWYGIMYFQHGRLFLEDFIWKHHLQRYLTSELAHPAPWWFYVPVLLAGLFPWTAHLALVRPSALRKDNRRLFLLLWIGLVTLFFSLSQAKLPGYILPALPATALWIGDDLRHASVTRLRVAGLVQAVLLPVFALAWLLPAALAVGISRAFQTIPSLPLSRALTGFAVAGVLLAWLAWRGRRLGATVFVSGVTAGAMVWALGVIAPAVDRAASARSIAPALCDKPLALGTVRRSIRHGLEFYCDRPFRDSPRAPYLLSSAPEPRTVLVQTFPESGLNLWRRQ